MLQFHATWPETDSASLRSEVNQWPTPTQLVVVTDGWPLTDGGSALAHLSALGRGSEKSQVRQCLAFCTADFFVLVGL